MGDVTTPQKDFDARRLLPRDKFDVDAVGAITGAGYPAIAPILDELVDWTADSNWPIARPIADFLITFGEPMVAPISRVLRGTDGTHKYHCIHLVVLRLPLAALGKLERNFATWENSPAKATSAKKLTMPRGMHLHGWTGQRKINDQ